MTPEELFEEEIKEAYQKVRSELTTPEQECDFNFFRVGYLSARLLSGNQMSHLKEGNETLAKINPDEPIFVLRAQDITAPRVIVHWIELNLDIVSEAKQKEAYHCALAMKRYESRRNAT